MNKETLNDMFYFTPNPFPDDSNEELLNKQSLILLLKPISSQTQQETTLDLLLKLVYGTMKKAPGSSDSPSQILMKTTDDEEEETALKTTIGVWVPENKYVLATMLRLFFEKIVSSYLIQPPEDIPPHYAIIFNAIKRIELKELMHKYSTEILNYGFFTSEIPQESTLIAKSIKKYESSPERAQ